MRETRERRAKGARRRGSGKGRDREGRNRAFRRRRHAAPTRSDKPVDVSQLAYTRLTSRRVVIVVVGDKSRGPRERTAKEGPGRARKTQSEKEGRGASRRAATNLSAFIFARSRSTCATHARSKPPPLPSPTAFQLRSKSHQRCAGYIRSSKFFLQHG